jgi:hypothetical protein
MSGTAALAHSFALLMGVAASPATDVIEQRRVAALEDRRDMVPMPQSTIVAMPLLREAAAQTLSADVIYLDAKNRETTPKEHTIGELRSWKSLAAGWDGDRAQPPQPASLLDAVKFVKLLSDSAPAEPMLHASGFAGLFWKAVNYYADLEFLGGRIAYFVEKDGGKHKGVVNFDAKEMPAVLKAILPI